MDKEISLTELKSNIENVIFYNLYMDLKQNILTNQYLFEDSLYSSVVTSKTTTDSEVVDIIFDFVINEDRERSQFFSFLSKLGFTENTLSLDKLTINKVGVAVGKDSDSKDSLLVFSIITVPDEMKEMVIDNEKDANLQSLAFKEYSVIKYLFKNNGLDAISNTILKSLEFFDLPANIKKPSRLN